MCVVQYEWSLGRPLPEGKAVKLIPCFTFSKAVQGARYFWPLCLTFEIN